MIKYIDRRISDIDGPLQLFPALENMTGLVKLLVLVPLYRVWILLGCAVLDV